MACLSAAVMQYNPKVNVECVIDVDVGQGRCGLSTPAEAVTLAQSVLSLEGQGVTFKGGIQVIQNIGMSSKSRLGSGCMR